MFYFIRFAPIQCTRIYHMNILDCTRKYSIVLGYTTHVPLWYILLWVLSIIGYNLAFIRNSYGLNISEHTMSDCIRFSRPSKLCSQELFIVEELKSLLQSRDGSYHINGFSNSDVSALIALLCTMWYIFSLLWYIS